MNPHPGRIAPVDPGLDDPTFPAETVAQAEGGNLGIPRHKVCKGAVSTLPGRGLGGLKRQQAAVGPWWSLPLSVRTKSTQSPESAQDKLESIPPPDCATCPAPLGFRANRLLRLADPEFLAQGVTHATLWLSWHTLRSKLQDVIKLLKEKDFSGGSLMVLPTPLFLFVFNDLESPWHGVPRKWHAVPQLFLTIFGDFVGPLPSLEWA